MIDGGKTEIINPISKDSSFDIEKWIEPDESRKIDNNKEFSVDDWVGDMKVSDASKSKENTDNHLKHNDSEISEENKIEQLKCPNEDLADKVHPITGVKFERKIVDLGDKKVEGVFPVFDSEFDAQLPEELLIANDFKQFRECNWQLKEEIKNNPTLCERFTDEQLEQIMDGETPPDGMVWHHNEDVGKMQLVDFKTHFLTHHRGGKSIWGGGKDCR